ncbi:MAG: HD domain-containing protein [Roseburia sp.]|nr:HD domain-containing protein [Roseburia sp.]
MNRNKIIKPWGRTIYGRMIFWCFLFFSVVFFQGSDAQASSLKNPLLDEGRSAVLYDSQNGMAPAEANAIVQTSDGFIWVGCYRGLARYDGNEFSWIDAEEGITSVASLYVDTSGRLWVGTNDNGAALYDNGEFYFFDKGVGLESCSIKAISEDAKGNILLGTTQGIAYIDADMQVKNMEEESIRSAYISKLERDEFGNVYGVTLSGDVFSISGLKVEKFFPRKQIGDSLITSICPSGREVGEVYLGTEDAGILRVNLLAEQLIYKRISTFNGATVNKMFVISDESLVVCADTGMGYVNKNGTFSMVTELPMNNSIDDMMEDYEGNFWFASSRQGIMKLAKSRFRNISLQAGLSNLVVNSTCRYDDMIYIGSDSGLYIVNDWNRKMYNELTRLLEGVRVRCIKEDAKGDLWLCTYGRLGLVCYHPNGTYECYTEEQGLNSDHIRTVLELSNGDMAVAASGGVNILHEGRVVKSYGSGEGIGNMEILCLEEGEEGLLYAGSDGGGIFVIDMEKETVDGIGQSDGLTSGVIMRIKKDEKYDGYWVITGNSIAYMKNECIRTIHSFPYANNFDIFYDDQDKAWILSGIGIYCVEVDKLYEDAVTNYQFYDTSLGLPSNVTANSRNFLGEDGTLYLSGTSGVSSLNINEAEREAADVRLAVPFASLDNEIVYFHEGNAIEIPKDCKRVTIYGYVLNYSLYNPTVSYYLEGFDEQPQITNKTALSAISYTNLAGKDYVFHLSALDGNTGEAVNEVTVRLRKERRLYEQPWYLAFVIALVIVGVMAGTWLYTRRKTAELLRKQRENKLFETQMIRAFSKAIDVKDKYTNGHSARVAKYSQMIARQLGCKQEQIDHIHNIALLHDIGKIFIPDHILNKPQPLTDEEFEVMKHHTSYGSDILKEIKIFPDMALGAGYHHERLDGNGYPNGTKGEDIPFSVRIVAVADSFDAMNSDRPYRDRMKMDVIVSELEEAAGTQLDADVVRALLELIRAGKIK